MMALVNSADHASAVSSFQHSVQTSMALKAQFTGLGKLYQQGYTYPTVVSQLRMLLLSMQVHMHTCC